ncbi:MAG: hypothetical protein HEQ37_07695 [Acidovorax sp.]|nr:hypothetical protein [Acidovorax sp.]
MQPLSSDSLTVHRSIGSVLVAALAVLALVFSASAASAFAALVKSNGSLDQVTREITVLQDLSDAVNHTRTSRVWMVQASVYGSYGMFKESAAALATARSKLADSRSAFGRYEQSAKGPAEEPLARVAAQTYAAYLAEGLDPLITALEAGQPAKLHQHPAQPHTRAGRRFRESRECRADLAHRAIAPDAG